MATADQPNFGDYYVVGVDGSRTSLQAVRWAQYLAGRSDATIEVLSTWEAPIGLPSAGWSGDWPPEQNAKKIAADAAHEVFGEDLPPHVLVRTRQGAAAATLLDASKHATMLLVASRGYGGFVGMLLGSVSAAVAEHATCPVLVVHGDTLPTTHRAD
jgi:nucleotide-binding universal stress UspA family protein